MSSGQPLQVLPWLVSRASGIVALAMVSLAVLLGLAMASRTVHRPPMRRLAVRLHEHIALIALAAICLHGLTLLGDKWLKPGLVGISVPFALSYRPVYTGIGIIGGYGVMLLGPSFYLRRRIGARRWRRIHPVLMIAWILTAVHTLGAGSDSGQIWLRVIVLAPLPAVAYLGVARLAGRKARPHAVSNRPGTRAVSADRPAPRAVSADRPGRAVSADRPTPRRVSVDPPGPHRASAERRAAAAAARAGHPSDPEETAWARALPAQGSG